MLVNINDSNFKEEVLEKSNEMPVIVDFFATWCPPCQALKPVLEKIGNENDKVVIAIANVDDNPTAAKLYGVMSVPSVKMFKDNG